MLEKTEGKTNIMRFWRIFLENFQEIFKKLEKKLGGSKRNFDQMKLFGESLRKWERCSGEIFGKICTRAVPKVTPKTPKIDKAAKYVGSSTETVAFQVYEILKIKAYN